MTEEELKNKLQTRDRVVRILSKSGDFRAVAIKNTEAAKLAQSQHQLDHVPAYYLAKTLSAAVMLSAFLKGEERISVELTGTGVISRIFAEALQVGECRGFVNFSKDYGKKPLTTLINVLGAGMLKITRILYNNVEPIVGIVPLEAGDVATDLAYYFAQSEQINSAVILDVDFDNNGIITSSGGVIVQAMPGATELKIKSIVESLSQINSLCDDFSLGLLPEEVLSKYLPFEFDIIKKTQVDFFCRCSKESFMAKLLMLEQKEIENMKNSGHNELVCQFCNKHYYLEGDDFKKMLLDINIKKN